MRRYIHVICSLLLVISSACSLRPNLGVGSPLDLGSSTENSVAVAITLELDSAGQVWLAATFTPLEPDTHVYSKDLPRNGVDGLGRPSLLELVPGSQMRAVGPLVESILANETDLDGLLIYPAGPVTLRLPISLPPGDGWVDENVSITYMACGNGSCRPPVIGKIIPVRVPGAELGMKP
jgi:hypothetical protein